MDREIDRFHSDLTALLAAWIGIADAPRVLC